MEKIKTLGKITIALAMSFLIMKVFMLIFINNSPSIRPNPIEYLAGYFKELSGTMIANLTHSTDKKNPAVESIDSVASNKIINDRMQELASAPLREIAKGIHAQENGKTRITTIDMNQVDKISYTMEIDGKKVQVTIPKVYYDEQGFSEQKIKALLSK